VRAFAGPTVESGFLQRRVIDERYRAVASTIAPVPTFISARGVSCFGLLGKSSRQCGTRPPPPVYSTGREHSEGSRYGQARLQAEGRGARAGRTGLITKRWKRVAGVAGDVSGAGVLTRSF
jgi:hypothetical protein